MSLKYRLPYRRSFITAIIEIIKVRGCWLAIGVVLITAQFAVFNFYLTKAFNLTLIFWLLRVCLVLSVFNYQTEEYDEKLNFNTNHPYL